MRHLIRSARFAAPARYRGRPILVETDEEGRAVDWCVLPEKLDPPIVPLPRGVHPLPYLSAAGHPYLIAVDRHGDYLSHAQVCRPEDRPKHLADLQRLLDRMDPEPARDQAA